MRIDKNTTIRLGDRNIVKIKIGDSVIWQKTTEPVEETNYFYIESLGDGNSVKLITYLRNTSSSSYITPTIEYSTDKQNWTTITFDWSTTGIKNINIPVVLNTGDKMYFRNDTGKFSRTIYHSGSYEISYITFTTDWNGRVNVGGDIRTLINYRNIDNTILEDGMFSNLFIHTYGGTTATARIVDASNLKLPFTEMTMYCYYQMFKGCNYLTSTPELPATTLATSCYDGMFWGCTSLTTLPELPATILSKRCYSDMFRGCSKLTTVPTLPATTLANECYQTMFYDCTSLTTAPKLPATTLAEYCYSAMFRGCSKLTTAPELPLTTLATSCYDGMFQDCTSLVNVPELPATNLESSCYSSMFQGCTSLVNAPALPATTLANYCYQYMFQGCTSLNKILVYANSINSSGVEDWLYNVAATGTFYNAGSAVYTTDSPSGIPTGWTEVTTVPTTTSVYAVPNTFTAKSWMDIYKLNYIIMGLNETGIDVPLGEQNELITIGKNTGSSTVTHTETLTYDGMDYTITINQTANDTDEPDYFYIESLGDGNTISVINQGNGSTSGVTPTLEYSTDKNTWDTITFDWARGEHTTELPIALNTGEKMYFRNDTRKFSEYINHISFSSSVSSNVGGDIRTLSNYLDVNSETKSQSSMFRNLFYNNKYIVDASNLRLPYTSLEQRCYSSMFSGCTSLTSAPTLPATTLAYYCYQNMFRDCTSLTNAPALPATTLAERCYSSMFQNCGSLVNAPELPATTLANMCYDSMFYGCTSLTTAPTLPATTLVNNCYSSMFSDCTSLTTAPELPTTTLASQCYQYMFQDCTSLTTAPTLPATTLESWCYGNMFQGCTSLTTAPTLPATTLANSCYSYMFQDCTSLTTAPELPATTIADSCYTTMFKGCTSLTTAPELPATTLESWCYYSMFSGCTSLTTAPALPATTLVNSCYDSMFQNCTSLTTAPELPATTLVNNCYSSMFDGCNSLTSVTIYATSTANNSFDSWLDNVAPSGTVYNNGLLNLPKNSASGIPIGWTEVLPPIQSITANPDTFTIKSYKDTVKCTSTLTITTTLGTTITDTNTATFTVGENTGDTTRTLTETIPYKGSSYQITIVQTANDVKPVTSWNVVSTGTYPFELNTNGYYESTNKGHDNSYSYATLNYQGFDELVLECINSGESNYDYGIISQPDVLLSESIEDDGATGSAKVFKNFKGESSTNLVQITIPSDGESHFITIKFRKDSSTSSGNDSLQFKVIEP